MVKETICVNIPNEGEINLDVEVVKTWEPNNINYVGTVVFFKVDDTYLSMTRDDFKRIYNK